MDINRLTKLLNLSTSPADGEALAAIRKANQMLKAENLSWEKVLEGDYSDTTAKPGVDARRQQEQARDRAEREKAKKEEAEEIKRASERSYTKNELNFMLKFCIKATEGPPRAFLESLQEFLDIKGFLTPAQTQALLKFHRNIQARYERQDFYSRDDF